MLDIRLMIVNAILKSRRKKSMNLHSESTTFEAFIHGKRLLENMEEPPHHLEHVFDITCQDISGSQLYYLKNRSLDAKSVIFYLHGGAYVTGPHKVQWDALSEIAIHGDVDLILYNYPAYPEGNAIKALETTMDAYMHAVELKRHIILVGDSAGGGLALLLMNALQQGDTVLPEKMILISPWLDVSMSNPAIRGYEATDKMLNIDFLKKCGEKFADTLDTKDPEVSPIYHQYHDLIPTWIFISDAELLYPDCIAFYDRLTGKGLPVTLHTGHKMPHGWVVLPMLKQAKESREAIISWIKTT